MKRAEIELKLQELMQYLDSFVSENGYPPSVREICRDLNLHSTATAFNYLEKLKKRGLINKSDSKNRAIGLCRTPNQTAEARVPTAPLLGEVACGSPMFAQENIEEYYPLPPQFKSGENVFLLRARGESMVDAGIFSGDKLICKKQETANDGDIVVALLDDSATVKRFYKKSDYVILHPENKDYSDIMVRNVQILGKVVGLYRNLS